MRQAGGVRGFAEVRRKAKSWDKARRAIARIEATPLGLGIRFVVTNIEGGSAEWMYETLYCARGEMNGSTSSPSHQAAQSATGVRPHLPPLGVAN